MDWPDVEGLAEYAYKCAGLDTDRPESPLAVGTGLIGTDRLRIIRTDGLKTPACLARVGSEWRIYLRRRLTPRAMRWLIWHELAEWILTQEDYRGSDAEQVADSLAACLRAPRRAVLRVTRSPQAWVDLSTAFDTSASSAVLRVAEVLGTPTALVAPRSVRVRGDEWAWPSEPEIRRLARAKSLPGVHRAKLRDDPRRVALVAVSG